MQDKPDSASEPEPAQTPTTPRKARRLRHGESRDTLYALAKDLQNVTAHSQVLHDQAQRTLDAVRATRARAAVPSPPQDLRLTVPEACRIIGVCERALRLSLREPALAARTQEGTRKAGTFYKTLQLLPPDLVDDLQLRFSQTKKRRHSSE